MNRPYEVFDSKWARKYYKDRSERRRSRYYKYNRDLEHQCLLDYLDQAELEWVQQLSEDVLTELLDNSITREESIKELTSEKVVEPKKTSGSDRLEYINALLRTLIR